MPNPISVVAKQFAAQFRRLAATVDAVAESAEHGTKAIDPEQFAADVLEKLAKVLRSKSKKR
jgi:hypothetical protein